MQGMIARRFGLNARPRQRDRNGRSRKPIDNVHSMSGDLTNADHHALPPTGHWLPPDEVSFCQVNVRGNNHFCRCHSVAAQLHVGYRHAPARIQPTVVKNGSRRLRISALSMTLRAPRPYLLAITRKGIE